MRDQIFTLQERGNPPQRRMIGFPENWQHSCDMHCFSLFEYCTRGDRTCDREQSWLICYGRPSFRSGFQYHARRILSGRILWSYKSGDLASNSLIDIRSILVIIVNVIISFIVIKQSLDRLHRGGSIRFLQNTPLQTDEWQNQKVLD